MALALPSFASSSATVAVEKATSDLLIGPDWTINLVICDSVNSNRWQVKDVMKAIKKRLQHRNPRVQLLALTLLETMVKNCGDNVHFQVAEKNILGEMVKIIKKKTDMQVRDKILVLLDSWQEAFGGPGGKYPQYHWASEELKRSGVMFPQRSLTAAPIITPPVTNRVLGHPQSGYGMYSNSSKRLDETMATEVEGLSVSSLDSMRNVMDLLSDMLQAVNPGDREAVKDEIIVDLVTRCRSNQKLLMQMLTTTGNEDLLGRGLELNDSLQILLAKHDAITSGVPMLTLSPSLNSKPIEGGSDSKPAEEKEISPKPSTNPDAVSGLTRCLVDEEDAEEDDFVQLARRHSKAPSSPSRSTSGTSGSLVLVDTSMPSTSSPVQCNVLALPDPPAPGKTTKEQDMIDLLSITLSTMSTAAPHPQASLSPSTNNQSTHEIPVSRNFPETQGQLPYNNYVTPWAQPQQHLQSPFKPNLQPYPQPFQTQVQPQSESPAQMQQHLQTQYWLQPQNGTQLQYHSPHYSSGYPPPPWAATPSYAYGQNHLSTSNSMLATGVNGTASYPPIPIDRPLHSHNSFHSRGSNGSAVNGGPWMTAAPKISEPPGKQKPFVPSYRLFEDLNVLGDADARFKMTGGTSPSLSGSSSQGMVGRRK